MKLNSSGLKSIPNYYFQMLLNGKVLAFGFLLNLNESKADLCNLDFWIESRISIQI